MEAKPRLIEKVKYRNQLIDAHILHLVEGGELITPEEISRISKKPLSLVKQRLDVLRFLGIIEYVKGDAGLQYVKERTKVILKHNTNFPLNAEDLELTAREKLVVLALWNLGIADADTILDWLKLNSDHTKSKLNVYFVLRRLVDLGIVEEIRKESPMLKLKGRKVYYSLTEQIVVFDTPDSLLKQCKDYYERKFGADNHGRSVSNTWN